jgi:hypothetical protein
MVDGIKTFDEVVNGLLTTTPASTGAFTSANSTYSIALSVPGRLDIKGAEQELGRAEPTEAPQPDQRSSEADKAQGANGPSPIVEPEEDTVSSLVDQLRTVLGVDDADEQTLLSIIQTNATDANAVKRATASVQAAQSFAQQYPAEYARMQALEKTNRESQARTFAATYLDARIEKDGVPTDKGFSALTCEKIEGAYLAAVEHGFDTQYLTEVLDSIKSGGLVDHKEHGTSNAPEIANTPQAIATQFSDKMKAIMAADNVDATTATRLAAEQNPALWAAYRESTGRPVRS